MIEIVAAATEGPPLLFMGEGPGSASYLTGALQSVYAVTRVFGNQPLSTVPEVEARLAEFRVLILSDYGAPNLTDAQQDRVAQMVERDGVGLLMIGGWSSFAGPRGSWHGSRLAELLPVAVSPDDDRVNTPLGTVFAPRLAPHPAIATVQKAAPCVICGFNGVTARPGAEVVVDGFALRVPPGAGEATLEPIATPMLALWQRGRGRVAALAPDVSPHWAGGIVDWGEQRLKLPTGSEVGHLYRAFLLDLCGWLMPA